MRFAVLGVGLAALVITGCSGPSHNVNKVQPSAAVQPAPAPAAVPAPSIGPPTGAVGDGYRGFDRNDYPGDVAMDTLHTVFAFTGYWLTNPPGENTNSWLGKRSILRQQGWGFLVLANGRLDAEILKAQKSGTSPADLARKDAAVAVAAARSEGFPAQTLLFLDQEEGGLLLDEQSAYLLAWTEAVSTSDYRAGVYASGQPVPNGPGKTITTIDDIRSRIKTGHLHQVAMFDAQDTCPPAPGCTIYPKPLSDSGELDLTVWQYAQSPRRRELTTACGRTYASDGNCYTHSFPTIPLDMDFAETLDPSQGR
jgi:hypothetical protein